MAVDEAPIVSLTTFGVTLGRFTKRFSESSLSGACYLVHPSLATRVSMEYSRS
jgi:hypothetical protein